MSPFFKFLKDVKNEFGKVVWPKPKEARTTTAIVIAFFLAMTMLLWGFDKSLELAIYRYVLGWPV